MRVVIFFSRVKARNLLVYAGSSDIFGGIRREIDYFILHPKYNNETVDYDIAIIKVGKLTLYDLRILLNKIYANTF